MPESKLLQRLLEHDYSVFTEQSLRHFGNAGQLNKAISRTEQESAYEQLKLVTNYDHFYFVTNIETNELGDSHGVGKFLGYTNKEFTMKKYLSIIHPKHLLPRNMFVYFWREQMMAGNFNMKFMDHRFITRVAVRRKDGKYVLLKYMSFLFQKDEKNRVTEYMNLASVQHDFNNESYSMLINDKNGDPLPEWEEKVRSGVKRAFITGGVFSEMQVEIFKYISENRKPDVKIVDIAAGLKEHEENIKTQCRRVKEKINDLFNMNFTTSRAAFSFLLTQGLI